MATDRWLQKALPALAEVLEQEQVEGLARARERMEAYRQVYLGLRDTAPERPLARLSEERIDEQIARAKGVWVLWMLRNRIGEPAFQEFVSACGLVPAGAAHCPQTRGGEDPGERFRRTVTRHAGGDWAEAFIEFWVDGIQLPAYRLLSSIARPRGGGFEVTLKVANTGTGTYPAPVAVQTEEGARHTFPVSVPAGATREVSYALLTRPVSAAIDPEMEVLMAGPREGWRPVRLRRWWIF